jgi:hypothetical protein
VGTQARFLHVLVPANSKDLQLCKTLMSSAMLTYPVPTLINWEHKYDNGSLDDGGWHLGVIEGVYSYLKDLEFWRDGDLAIIPQGYDTWFQLRPGTLIERFYEINRQADETIRTRIGKDAAEKEGISQKVIFSAHKTCPAGPDDVSCYAVPESPLAKHVYGPNTDRTQKNEDPEYLNFRERYLNTGLIMGEVGALKKLYAHALEVLESHNQTGTVQSTFSQIFGEQEYQREIIRERNRPGATINFKKLFGFEAPGILDLHPPSTQQMSTTNGTSLEYGIGLDYESLLSQSTISVGRDSQWLVHSDTSQTSKAGKDLKVTGTPKTALPGDILRTPSPFWSRSGAVDGFPRVGWEGVPLYTNLWTGNIPATLHRSEESEQAKAFWASGWTGLWYHKYARHMMNAYGMEPYHAFAVTREKGQAEVAWWPRYEQKWQIKSDSRVKEFVEWSDLCQGFEGEIFEDGRGAWGPSRGDF